MSEVRLYSLDTSWLINLEANYPIDIFPPVWERLDGLLKSGSVYIINLVSDEINDKDDAVSEWLKKHPPQIVQQLTDEDLIKAQEIIALFPAWIDIEATKNNADPFVVAQAVRSGATVVTHETKMQPSPNSKKAKIPNACESFQVRCIHTVASGTAYSHFFREHGWRF